MSEHETAKSQIAKSAGVVAFFTILSRITGLVRDIMTFHIFGATGLTDAFFAAFTIPNTMRRFVAEGALTISFIPVYTEVREQKGDAEAKRFYAATLGMLLIFLTVLTALGVLFAPQLVYAFASGFASDPTKMQVAGELTRVMFPYVFLISLVALAMGILNAHKHFAAPAFSQVMLNLGMIIFPYAFASYFVEPIYALAISVVIGGVLQLLSQIPALWSRRLLVWPSREFSLPAVKKLVRLMTPALFGLAVYQINIIVLRQLGSYLPDGQMSHYYNADRLMQFALGVFAFSIATAALPAMSGQTARGNKKALISTWNYSTRLTNYITVPAAFGLMAVGIPIVAFLYLHGKFTWRDVELTGYTTVAFAPGLIAVALSRTTVQAFYALEDMKSPVVIGAITVIANLLIGLWLIQYEVVGLATTLTLSSFLQTAMLLYWLRRRVGLLGGRLLVKSLLRQTALSIVVVTIAYYVALHGEWQKGPNFYNGVILFGAIFCAIGLYAGGSLLFHFDEAIPVRDAAVKKVNRLLRRR